MKKLIVLFLFPFFFLLSCAEEDENPNVVIIMGYSSGSLYFSNLPEPLVVDKDFIHTTRTVLDLNGDDVGELTILSSEELTGTDTLFRTLKLEKHPNADTNVRISLLADYTVTSFLDGESVEFPRGDMYSLQDEFILTWNKHIISTGADFVAGSWNGLLEHCFLVEYKVGESDIAAWVMLSVTDYDNYILHNFASYSLPKYE
jgi:hypothetical protein